jgi:carbamoyl-phosphate synthase/aspartate carbamoyltransferase/dihydroorotase
MLKHYPGLIDIHVHLRDPGATYKEDFASGSRAALAGGFTFVCDMPNNRTPTFTISRLNEKIELAKKLAVCDIGFHFGTNGKNLSEFPSAWLNPHVFGLKIYCNHTTGDFLVDSPRDLDRIFVAWQSEKPILVHAEDKMLSLCIVLAKKYHRRLHVCHISTQEEVAMVRNAKKYQNITAGVSPHHLFLTTAIVKPNIGTKADRDALWEGLQDRTIDIVESDHAPHTKQEKEGPNPPSGVPGLETTLGLLFLAVHDKKLNEADVIRLLYTNPKAIFHIPDQKNTSLALDPEMPYRMGCFGYQTKCGWSPFDGWTLFGKVEQVILRDKIVYEENKKH